MKLNQLWLILKMHSEETKASENVMASRQANKSSRYSDSFTALHITMMASGTRKVSDSEG